MFPNGEHIRFNLPIRQADRKDEPDLWILITRDIYTLQLVIPKRTPFSCPASVP